MKKLLLGIALIVIFNATTKAQQTPVAYLYKNIYTMSKDSILQAGQLNIDDASYEVEKFTYIISLGEKGSSITPQFAVVKGNKFPKEFTEQINLFNYGKMIIQDIWIKNKTNPTERKKLESAIGITFN